MSEETPPWDECIKLSDFARQRNIDSALLRLLAEGGHIPTVTARRGSYRFPPDCELTAQEAEAKGRATYDAMIEEAGRQVQKVQKRMSRLLQELEQQQEHLDEVVPLGPGLLSVVDRAFGRNSDRWGLEQAVHDLRAWNEVLGNIDDLHRTHADLDADAEILEHSATPSWEGPFALMHRSTRPSARKERRTQVTPLADELPDGVDELSPEARRTVLDLLRVLVVAETGGR